jgi:hypothetical protein
MKSPPDITQDDIQRLFDALQQGGGIYVPFESEEKAPNVAALLNKARAAVEDSDRVLVGSPKLDEYGCIRAQYACRRCVKAAGGGGLDPNHECPHGTKGIVLSPRQHYFAVRQRIASFVAPS